MQGADQFPQTGTWYSIFLSLGFLIFGAAPWLAPGGGSGLGRMPRRRTVTSAAASLFVPRYENCRHLAFPDTSQNETKWTGAEARRGGERRNWFLLIHAARGTLHLIWPSISRNDLNTFCVKQCTGLVRGALCCSCTRWIARCVACVCCPGLGEMLLNYASDKSVHVEQVSPQTRIRVKLMNEPEVRGAMTLFSLHFIPLCQEKTSVKSLKVNK